MDTTVLTYWNAKVLITQIDVDDKEVGKDINKCKDCEANSKEINHCIILWWKLSPVLIYNFSQFLRKSIHMR